jgi:imidazolonepropionase-like amidohydrolase
VDSSQAAIAHSFGLPEIKALQSVTSVPARSLELDHRIGFVKAGYDADIVVWNSHPLAVGATPQQVYIDGKETLENKKAFSVQTNPMKEQLRMRTETPAEDVKQFCSSSEKQFDDVIITGITASFLDDPHGETLSSDNLTMVINAGKISCFGDYGQCVSEKSVEGHVIRLKNGHVLPGLTTISTGLGLVEIDSERSTADGSGSSSADVLDPESALYAKYGVHLEGKAFARARLGGVTRAITIPSGNDFLLGVSTGIKTAEKSNPLNGGIFRDDAALHFVVGQDVKGASVPFSSYL